MRLLSDLCKSGANILAEVIGPDPIEGEDDGNDNDGNPNDNVDDLNCPPTVTRPSKGDIQENLDKLQDLPLLSSYGDEIRTLILKIETFLNKEQTECLRQSYVPGCFQLHVFFISNPIFWLTLSY